MALEQARKEAKRMASQNEEEMEEIRCNSQKKVKCKFISVVALKNDNLCDYV